MDNDFLVKIMAMLETKGIKDDYEKIKQMFLKDPTKINTVMDMSATKTEINKFIKEYAPKLQEMFSNLGVKGINVKDIESSLKTIFSSYQKELKNMPKIIDRAYGSNNKLNDSMEITKNRAKGASQSFQSYIKSLKPIALKQYSNEINQISDSFSKASESGKSIDLSKANSHLSKFKSEMKNAGMETATLTQKLKENIGAFSQWYFIGNAIGSLVRNFKASINTIKEVDTYLTEISKTSEISAENLKKLGIDAFDYASKYGSTVGAYLSGVQEMSRAGYDESIAKGLAELSILAQSAGDMTDELANEYLIATNAAYKYEGNIQKLNDVLDSQNQVTNRNSITMSKLAEATKIAGSQAASSGVEVDELTAAITTMGVVTQAEGGVLGRAFRTILMNLRQVKGEVDGEIINEESFTKVEKAADSLGVKLKETRDGILSLRDPMQILKELAEEYSKLAEGDVRGADLISSLGGKRQGNQLIALLENFDMYEKVLNDYKNASGSAADEAQKTADSIEGRLNQLSNTWNRTVANVVDSDLIKGLTSTSTNVIDLVDKLNLLQTALITLGGFGTFKFFTGFVPMIKNAITSTIAFGNALNTVKAKGFVADTTNLSNAIKGLTLSQASAVLSTKTLSKETLYATLRQAGFSKAEAKTTASTLAMSSANAVATTSTMGLGASIKALTAAMAANPIGLIITGITVALSAYSLISNKVKQAQQEAIETSKRLTQQYKDEKQSLDEQIIAYEKLQKQLDEGNLSVEETKSIKEQLLSIQNTLIESYDLEALGLDSTNEKYKEQLQALRELSKEKAQSYVNEHRDTFDTAKRELGKERTYDIGTLAYFTGDLTKQQQSLKEFIENYNEAIKLDTYQYDNNGRINIKVVADVEEADTVLDKLATDLEKFGKENGVNVTSILNSISGQLRNTWTEELNTYKTEHDTFIEASIQANDVLGNLYLQSKQAVNDYNKALSSGEGIEEAKNNLDDLKNKVSQNTNEVEGSQKVFDDVFSKISTGAQQTGREIKDNFTFSTSTFDTLNKSLDDLDKKSKDAVSSVKELNQVLYDQSQGTKLTSEQAYKLITQYPQLASALEKTSDGYVINEEAINLVREALIEQEKANATAQLNMTTDTLGAVKDRVEAYGIELEAITNLQSTMQEQKKLPWNYIFGMEGTYFDDSSRTITTPKYTYNNLTQEEYEKYKKSYKEQELIYDTIGKMGNLQERINGLQNDLISDEGFGVNYNKDETPEKEFEGSIDWSSNSLQTLQNAVKDAQETLENTKGYEEQQKAIENLTKAQEALRKGYQNTADMYESQYKSIGNIGSYKKLIETGATFKIEDFIGKEELYKTVTKAQDFWKMWQDNLTKVKQTTNDITNNYKTINDTLDSISNDVETIQSAIIDALSNQYKDMYDDRVRELNKIRDLEIENHNSRIKFLQEEIDKIRGNTVEDKYGKLSGLRGQYSQWLADDSTLGKAKQKELLDQIMELNKEIQIDLLETQIENEQEAIENANKKLENQLDEFNDGFDTQLNDLKSKMTTKELLTEANGLLKAGRFNDIYTLLSDHGKDSLVDNMATLMGESAGTIIADKIATALGGLPTLLGDRGTGGGSNSNGSSQYSDDIKKAQVLDVLGTPNEDNKAKDSSNLSTLNKYLMREGYDTATKKDMVEMAQTLGIKGIDTVADVQDTTDGRENKIRILTALKRQGFWTGGETGNDEGLAYLHKKERILTPTQTDAFNKLVYDYIPNMFDRLVPNKLSNIPVVNNSNSMNFNREIVKVENINNYTPFDVKNEGDNLSRKVLRGLQKAGVGIPM